MSELPFKGASIWKAPPCARCHGPEAVLILRTEHLCQTCFTKYVTTKVLKRLEVNKVRGAFREAPRNLLLPLSLGPSSITMLHILDEQLRSQRDRSGRSSYCINVLHVDQSPLVERPHHQKALALLKERFPSHTYSIILLEDVFDFDVNLEEEILGSRSVATKTVTNDKNARLQHLMSSLSSATSRCDVVNLLKLKLISEVAKQRGYDCILYGDSTTRLAERTLSETAKGRGGSLPWLTADGVLPHGLKIIYPMRDLLKKEILTYASMTSPPLTTLVLDSVCSDQSSVSSKATTIDSLMGQFFESVEQNYPSIVANVVRTSSKLLAPSYSHTTLLCSLCNLPIEKVARRWGGEQAGCTIPSVDGSTAMENIKALCYGCATSIKVAK